MVQVENNFQFKYSPKELIQFEGLYYCGEINKVYKIKSGDSALILQLDDDELSLVTKEKYKFSFHGAMILSFEMSNSIIGFTLDVGEDVKGLKFIKLK